MSSEETLHLSLDLASPSPKKTPSRSSSLPLSELLLLSPYPLRKSRTRLADRLEMAEEVGLEPNRSRRRCKTKGPQMGVLGCASPRNNRRSRRRSEMEIRDERDIGLADEIGKLRKRRHSVRSKKEKLSLLPCVPSPSLSPKMDDGGEGNFDLIGQMISDLILWRDVAKSSLWFGFGCLGFVSSSFAKGVSFSYFPTWASILRRIILLKFNLAKVISFLLLGAEYGHLITMWRLCAIGFFISFILPKLYSCYSIQINQKVENTKFWLLEAWGACSHKKVVAASAAMAFWISDYCKPPRIFTEFISLVILRCCQQHLLSKPELEEAFISLVILVGQQQRQALVVAEVLDTQKS